MPLNWNYADTRMAPSVNENFFQSTRAAKKIMVLDLGFLGDTVHLLPALWMIRQAYPSAELHVTVAAHITSLLDCVPWVDRVWGYMRYPRHATLRENFQMVARLRREKFDVLINLNGSDRSSWLTFFSGARERLGREPENGGPPFWKHMFTAHVRHPFKPEPIYVQRCRCLEKAGFPSAPPEFHVEIAAENLRAAEISEADTGTYFHISPFTTADYKELSPEQLAELVAALEKNFPGKKIVLSCAPTARELEKMEKLLAVAPAKTLARVCRQPESHATRRSHPAQSAAFLRRHRPVASGRHDPDADRRLVLAESRPGSMGADRRKIPRPRREQ